jgi:cellobiose PTS system EIIC component
VSGAARLLNRRILPALTAVSENTYMSAIRAGMVSVVPLTIIGGLFMIVAYLPVGGWDQRVAPYRQILQVPVAATFGLLGVIACFSIAYDLGRRLKVSPPA